MMQLTYETYRDQLAYLPTAGKHIIAHYDERSIVVYQAFNPQIGHFAATHGHFGDEFNLQRMTWVKTSFLWMMHRSGWATKENQEVILAIWLDVVAFDAMLKKAVISSFDPQLYESEDAWNRAGAASSVRLQWDPDYSPNDGRLERRAIQIGLRGKSAVYYAQGGWILQIEDITDFVRKQVQHVKSLSHDLLVPRQTVYPINNTETEHRIGISK